MEMVVNNSTLVMFKYLNRIREMGTINMFGASQTLEIAFDLNHREARKVLTDWMEWVNTNPDNLNL